MEDFSNEEYTNDVEIRVGNKIYKVLMDDLTLEQARLGRLNDIDKDMLTKVEDYVVTDIPYTAEIELIKAVKYEPEKEVTFFTNKMHTCLRFDEINLK